MKAEIKKILYKFLQDGISSDDAAQQILNLFSTRNDIPKNELIFKLIEHIETEKGGEIKNYENTMLCSKGKVVLTINIDYIKYNII